MQCYQEHRTSNARVQYDTRPATLLPCIQRLSPQNDNSVRCLRKYIDITYTWRTNRPCKGAVQTLQEFKKQKPSSKCSHESCWFFRKTSKNIIMQLANDVEYSVVIFELSSITPLFLEMHPFTLASAIYTQCIHRFCFISLYFHFEID
jgi:hypothetical protein